MGDHLLLLHSAVRGLPGYNRHDAPSMLMDGSSLDRDSEHGRAMTALLTRRHDTVGDAIEAMGFALGAADVPRGIRRQARAACEDYLLERLGCTPETALPTLLVPTGSLEPMPDEHYRVLEPIVEFVVDGDFDELHDLSHGRLAVEDLRRRLDDDCPEPLVLPPRETFRVEALDRSDDPDLDGWTFFVELWTDEGLARLHIEGVIVEEPGGGLQAALTDLLP